ncbi:MAG: bifunctional serine/threonine-protein kinase/universal stress protein [Beijerinckiaceae bacterium]
MASETLFEGAVIDGFVVGERVHQGGMAALWRVRRDDIDFPLVMKAPLLHDGEDATAIVGFEMEQMILPLLKGPHVPRFVAAGDFTKQPYIVMEYVQGKLLRPMLDDAPLAVETVADVGARAAIALDALHRQHVIHLDIKPSNIILRETGEAVLIDFGLSHHEMLPDLLAEEFRLPMGTGPYISPEQVRGIRTDPRSDIFSLGVLLYHLATGERPFGYPRTKSALKTRLWRDPTPLRQLRPEIPGWFQEIVLRCLESDPAERYPTAAQLAFDLQHPGSVRLTARAEKAQKDSILAVLRRRWNAGAEPAKRQPIAAHIEAAPIVMAAVDLGDDISTPSDVLREAVARILRGLPNARLACVNVLKINRIAVNYALDEQGRNIHVQRLVDVKDWARPLDLPDGRATFHVLESPDPAAALIDYARANRVDHVILGARNASALRNILGSVATRVVAEAPCTVTLVRPPPREAAGDEGADREHAGIWDM